MPLLEREAPLASLEEYATHARHGDGGLVLIAGEAGVGKSAPIEEAQRGLPDATWYWGACDGLFTLRPLCAHRAELPGHILPPLGHPLALELGGHRQQVSEHAAGGSGQVQRLTDGHEGLAVLVAPQSQTAACGSPAGNRRW